ncbi:hypothetical protein ABID19_005691 [Mesorhizobium robiniae]|uniref:Uncharacterized protein n=1 Tax=Mesorhizobium robiniae TaxID=559315 RepID=A0ABV2GWF8_9HYPH
MRSEQVPTWRVDLRAELPSGYGETFEAPLMVSGSEDVPYRVLNGEELRLIWNKGLKMRYDLYSRGRRNSRSGASFCSGV